MLAISRPAVALPSASSSMAQASSGALRQQRPGLPDDPLALDLAERDQPRTDTDEVGKRGVEEGEDRIVRADALRFRRCAEDHGLMPLRAPVAHRRGEGRKGPGREDVAIGAEQRAPGLERGLARLPAQLERAGDMVEVHEGVEIACGGATVGVRDRGSVRRHGAIAEPVAAGAPEAARRRRGRLSRSRSRSRRNG